MDTGNMTETEVTNPQPTDAVTADVETSKDPSQSEPTEELELHVEVEEGQEASNNFKDSPDKTYAAWKREKKKRQERQAELEAERKAREIQAKELESLKQTVANLTKGPAPTLESCDYDEGKYQEAVKQYYANSQTEAPAQQQEQKPQAFRSEDAEFYLYQKENEIKSKIPGYDKIRSEFDQMLIASNHNDVDAAVQFIADAAMKNDIDVSKVIVGMQKNPRLLDEAINAANSPYIFKDILKQAESKVSFRNVKPVESEPEPNITTSGNIDAHGATVSKLKDEWVANPTQANYKKYIAAKRKGE